MGGGGGPRRGPRPPGSTNFSASSSSILLLFFSLKERENKRRVSITLHTGRREGMGGEGTGRGVGGPRVAAATAHRRALSQPSPAPHACRARVLTAPRHPPYCSPPLPRCPHGGRGGGAERSEGAGPTGRVGKGWGGADWGKGAGPEEGVELTAPMLPWALYLFHVIIILINYI